MPNLYVGNDEMIERAIRSALGAGETFTRWDAVVAGVEPVNASLSGYALFGFGPARYGVPGNVLWVVLSQTYDEPVDHVRVDALGSVDDVDELADHYPDKHDRVMVSLWLTLGLGDALRAAFRRRALA